MIEQLKKFNPRIWELIKNELIGGMGIPDSEGDAHPGSIVAKAEDMYNAQKGTFWYRFFRPNDPFVGGTVYTYYSTMTTVTEEELLSLGAAITVKTREMIAIFGWILDTDLGKAGYVRILKFDDEMFFCPTRFISRMEKPKGYIFNLDRIFTGVENEKFQFITYNGLGADRVAISIPIMFRIASREALNLTKPSRKKV